MTLRRPTQSNSVKLANAEAMYDKLFKQLNPALRKKMYQEVLNYGGKAVLAGGAVAGLSHLLKQRGEQEVREHELGSEPGRIRIVSPKLAEDQSDQIKLAFLDGAKQYVKDVVSGKYALRPQDFIEYPTLMAAGIGGGAYLGYKGVDSLLDSMRTKQKKQEIERAQKAYLEALNPPQQVDNKLSAERGKLARDMDRIWSVLEKVSGDELPPPPVPDDMPGGLERTGSQLGGWYLAALAAAGLYGGTRGLRSARESSKTRAVEKAHAEQKLRDERQLPPMVTSVV